MISSFGFAQVGSVYSRFGVGEISNYISDKSAAMGRSGIVYMSEETPNIKNPAALSNINRTMLTAHFQYNNYMMDDGKNSSSQGKGNIESMFITFPVYKPSEIVFSAGLAPFSTVGYSLEQNSVYDTLNIKQQFFGSGNLTSAQVSLSYSPISFLSLGVTTQYFFGTQTHRQTLEFLNTNFYKTDVQQERSMKGVGFTIGGVFKGVDNLFSTEKNLNIGGAFFLGSQLNVDEETISDFSSKYDTTLLKNQTMKIPPSIALGISYKINRWMLVSDFHTQLWNDFSYQNIHPKEIQNSTHIGIGAEISPSKESHQSFFDELSYRIGAYMNTSYIKLNNTSIDEYFVTAGMGFSLSNDTKMNIGIEFGTRGTTSSSLIKDTITRLTVSFNASDIWFIQPEIE